jgi:hypothetical protein
MMPDEMSKKTGQINIGLTPETVETLEEIRAKHGLTGTEIGRRLFEAVADFYRTHGYFAFPVRIFPEAEFLTSVLQTAETAADRERLKASEKARADRKAPRSA